MNEPVVTVKQGKLRGGIQKSVLGSSFIAFHEIPFAAPPIGELRFKDPQPPAPWTDIKDTGKATEKRCPQMKEVKPHDVIGEEDCLYLNVYTNSLSECKPVMFWIHGGAFLTGTGSFKDKRPDYLLAKDVVVVSANYRLGAFGFLNLGHKAAAGNQGLKDLIAALEWVKENIANFGGDPNNVTIFGGSAGAALSQALTMSPRAQGLFHKAILQSGLLTCPWSINQSLPERGFRLAGILGKDSNDPEEETNGFCLPFGLNIDDIADNPVLPLPIEELLMNDVNIPIVVGYSSHESLMFIKDKSQKTMKHFDTYLLAHVKQLAMLKKLSPEDTETLLKTVRDSYFDGQSITTDKVDGLVRLIGDIYFGIPAKLYVEDRVKRTNAPTYFYVYSYVGTQKTHTDLLVERVTKGASHVDEMAYLFYLPPAKIGDPEPPAVGTKDRTISERITTLWTNVGKTGNPTPSLDDYIKIIWEPASKDKLQYLDIGEESQLLPVEPHILSSI
ncbi:Esterase E4 [Dufourea novaeangliae]|uniref:Carboxylic ester hydrolase n=1 Tax=Dufourea novaeangliae TaxID=178035 RepID=A0A154PJI9_DUFNO|nr:Esterase E4 [Dufourea novaeangliae]